MAEQDNPEMPDQQTTSAQKEPSPSPTTTQSIQSHLESLSKSCITSLNTRNFHPLAPGWRNTTPSWIAEFENHADSGSQHSGQDLLTFLALQKSTAEQFPTYHMKVTGISSDVDERGGRASVFTTVEVTGIPEGVIRQSMVCSEYVRVGGEWACRRCIGVRGVPHLSD